MKKWMILFLTVALVVSMAGCKRKGELDGEPTEFVRDENSAVGLQPDA